MVASHEPSLCQQQRRRSCAPFHPALRTCSPRTAGGAQRPAPGQALCRAAVLRQPSGGVGLDAQDAHRTLGERGAALQARPGQVRPGQARRLDQCMAGGCCPTCAPCVPSRYGPAADGEAGPPAPPAACPALQETAAIIIEPILGEGGFLTPPPGFLTRLRELCDRHGMLLIFDEVGRGVGARGCRCSPAAACPEESRCACSASAVRSHGSVPGAPLHHHPPIPNTRAWPPCLPRGAGAVRRGPHRRVVGPPAPHRGAARPAALRQGHRLRGALRRRVGAARGVQQDEPRHDGEPAPPFAIFCPSHCGPLAQPRRLCARRAPRSVCHDPGAAVGSVCALRAMPSTESAAGGCGLRLLGCAPRPTCRAH